MCRQCWDNVKSMCRANIGPTLFVNIVSTLAQRHCACWAIVSKIRSSAPKYDVHVNRVFAAAIHVLAFVHDRGLELDVRPANTTDHIQESCHGEKQPFLPIRLPLSGQINPSSIACTQSDGHTTNCPANS